MSTAVQREIIESHKRVYLIVPRSLSASATQTLNICTWFEYIDPEVVIEFEHEFDAKVVFHYFELDQLRDEQLAAVAGRRYDLLMVNGTQVARYDKRGWLEPID